ncbi:hypothetical protein [Kribbella deserti]|uniref:Abi-like protein n=1 Tax=Kribbella deserti TaxID=1926257 RepID=A0ABV6QVX8_9ACTN
MNHNQDLQRRIASAAGRHFGTPRFQGYLDHCDGDKDKALAFYQWNTEASAAMWETLGHLEVIFRNRVAGQLAQRHRRRGLQGSWLDALAGQLDQKGAADIAKARGRVQSKGKPVSDGQVIAELSFGFWRFLLARRYNTTLWPAIAGGFPNSPNRDRSTIERPVVRLNEFRNRLAHHERIWNQPLAALHEDTLTVIRYIDGDLADWVGQQSRMPTIIASAPQRLPQP